MIPDALFQKRMNEDTFNEQLNEFQSTRLKQVQTSTAISCKPKNLLST